ncbi:hypothetical protein AB4865_12070 [Capnocytophaga sp. ARDL2]|uniref:hypothetical protein n=1 Tax=Capnocytophaga sp. ARDL2 TaxID=3238809 RepID=UPI0035586734
MKNLFLFINTFFIFASCNSDDDANKTILEGDWFLIETYIGEKFSILELPPPLGHIPPETIMFHFKRNVFYKTKNGNFIEEKQTFTL